MKYILSSLLFFLCVTLHGQVLRSETLLDNGPSGELIDLVIIGDGYTVDDTTLFWNNADDIINKFYETEPFSWNMHRINIHVVTLISEQRGAGVWNQDTVNNALGSVFNYLNITQRLVRPLYDSVLVSILDSLELPIEQVLVIVNTGERGGYGDFTGIPGTNGGRMSVVTRDTIWNEMLEVGIHEMAHSWFDLSDTYVDFSVSDTIANNPLFDGPNVSLDTSSIEWASAMHLPDIGLYEGALYRPDRYRPSHTCKMRETGQPFCSWCRFIIEYRLNESPPPIDPTGITEEFTQEHIHDESCSKPHYNILGQEIPNPYGESVIVTRKKKSAFESENKKAQQDRKLAEIVTMDRVKAFYDSDGNEVRNLYQAKVFVTESGKTVHSLPIPGCLFSE